MDRAGYPCGQAASSGSPREVYCRGVDYAHLQQLDLNPDGEFKRDETGKLKVAHCNFDLIRACK